MVCKILIELVDFLRIVAKILVHSKYKESIS